MNGPGVIKNIGRVEDALEKNNCPTAQNLAALLVVSSVAFFN